MRKFLFAALVISGFLASGQDSVKTTLLNEIVFSANRTPETLLNVPRSATVITSEELRQSPASSVADLLVRHEGLYIVGAGQTPGSNQSVYLRGANSNQVVIMIDGKRINDPSTPNAVTDLSELSLAAIDRIEIIRGSHTTTFGGAAIGGVINIITSRPARDGLTGSAIIQGAAYGEKAFGLTGQLDLRYGARNGFQALASISDQRVNGLDASLERGEGYQANDKDGFNKTDYYVKAGFDREKVDAWVSWKQARQEADIDNGAFQDDDNNLLAFDRDLLDYQAAYTINQKWRITALGAITRTLRVNENDSSVVDDAGTYDHAYFKGSYRGRGATNELQLNYSGKNISAMFGSGAYYERMSFDSYYFSNAFGFPFELRTNYDTIRSSATTAYLFGKLSWQGEKAGITIGSRLSHHSLFGTNATWEVSPSLKVTNGLVYASISTGFNAPSLYQLYDPGFDYGAVTTRGNRSLEPETSLSAEVGFKRDFSDGSWITVSAFRTDTRNAIEYIFLWDGGVAVDDLTFSEYRGDTYINASRQTVAGTEVSGKAFLSDKFSLLANLTYQHGVIRAEEDDVDREKIGENHVQLYNHGVFLSDNMREDELPRRPRLLANATMTYSPGAKASFNLAYRLAGTRFDSAYDPTIGPFGALAGEKVGQYSLVDAGAAIRFMENFTTSLRVENIFDEKYSEISGYRTRGRTIYLRLVYQIR